MDDRITLLGRLAGPPPAPMKLALLLVAALALLAVAGMLQSPHFVYRVELGEPDPDDPAQRVAFGTSGHRGTSANGSFNEAHILATTQAICDYRQAQGIDGPLYLGKDTHALSGPAQCDALEVLAANGVTALIDGADRYTPTPALSHAILRHNAGRGTGLADGIVVTPSHNPPKDGGFKYNPPHGGPTDTAVTRWIEERANALLAAGPAAIPRMPLKRALANSVFSAPSRSRTLERMRLAIRKATSSCSVMPRSWALFSRIATRVSKSGGSIDTVSPQPKRERSRASMPSTSLG